MGEDYEFTTAPGDDASLDILSVDYVEKYSNFFVPFESAVFDMMNGNPSWIDEKSRDPEPAESPSEN